MLGHSQHLCPFLCVGKDENIMSAKFTKSFYDWCVENNRRDLIERWDIELNKCGAEDISFSVHEKYAFKCPRGSHKSEFNILNRITNMNLPLYCKQCRSFQQWCEDNNRQDILNLWDYNNNSVLPSEISRWTPKKYYFKCENGIHESELHYVGDLS